MLKRVVLSVLFLMFLVSTGAMSDSNGLEARSASRNIYLRGEIDDGMAALVKNKIEILNSLGREEITIYITSPGGSVYAGLLIYDAMMESGAPIRTVCEEYCASMAAFLVTSGDVREASKNTMLMYHQLSTGIEGGTKLNSVINEVGEANRLQDVINAILVAHSSLTLDEVKAMVAYDHYMSAEEAKGLGLIDNIKSYKNGRK